jgi:hypothetical protein
MPTPRELLDHVGTDEARAARHQDPHPRALL